MVYQEKELGCMTATLRYFLMLVNFLFIVASVAGIVVGVLLMEDKETNYLKFCSSCKGFSTFAVIVFAALAAFSLLGFCALWRRNSCMLYLYAFTLVIFFLAATSITIVVIMVHQGKFDKQLEDAWKDSVKEDPSGLCEFQAKVKCNGWDNTCGLSNATQGEAAYNGTDAEVCPDCRDQSVETQTQIASYDTTCRKMLKDDVNKYYYILLGVGCGLMALTLLSILISCKVRVQVEEYDELTERF